MITRDDIMGLVRALDPRFEEVAKVFLEQWAEDPTAEIDGLPHYLYFAEIADIIGSDFAAGVEFKHRSTFQLIDRLIVEGEHYVSEAAVVGLLEDIQNALKRRRIPLHRAHALLPSESRYQWDDLVRFWTDIEQRKPDLRPLSRRPKRD
ncbi:hypothetical protein [Porphyrobacter sp. ULC335]|uniref:DUF7674 family protein n=1 Tax=Porphyrobacter sp. ULC335 TaxID=2854260 RepID=UPI00222102FA|nr:hypothetical protein [Porphyrobacter sp. ULC335]UYV14977.1 hypothetical protein KVF90_12675 [Porphyrobacter sp. ULC335]